MKSRMFSVMVLVAVLAMLALPVSAQGSDDPICNGLSAGDCEIITAASKAMDGVSSFATPEWSINFKFDSPEGPVMFESSGTGGGFAVDPDAANPVDGLTVHLNIAEATVSGPDGPQSGSMEIIIYEGMVYLKVDGEWYGGPLEGNMTPPGALPGQGEMPDLSDLGDLNIDLTGVLTTERGPDTELLGQSMAVFTTTVDLPQLVTTLLTTPFTGALLGALGGTNLDMETPAPEELQFFGAMAAAQLENSSLTLEQWVGLDDGYIHHVAVDAVLALDLSTLTPEAGMINGEFHFMSDLDAIGEPLDVQVPESYLPLDLLNASPMDA
jgi:hypothetical protein